ncbi:hypothetical protein NOCA2140037 [metagenome]|uniref:Uncharacterized protein n=1 Tax=metagenome TaxID=256318 RepID=A0A2P2BWU2_9ZZZZ
MDIELSLGGEDGQITANVLHDALGETLELLKEAAEISAVDRQVWRIERLRVGSAHIALSAPQGPQVANSLAQGLDSLRAIAAIPEGWSRQMVKRVLDLGRMVGTGGATSVQLQPGPRAEPRALDAVTIDHAERALGSATAAYGSIRGRVDRWNEHSRREVGLTRDSGTPVAAGYASELSPRILAEAVGHEIEAWGVIRRNVVGQVTSMTIEDFRVVERPDPVSISSMAGVYQVGDTFSLSDWISERHGDA